MSAPVTPRNDWAMSKTMATNPYDSPNATRLRSLPIAKWIWPTLSCAFATVLSFPPCVMAIVWLWTIDKPLDNPAGLVIYMGMCIRSSVVLVPLNCLIIAPILHWVGGKTMLRSILLHLAIGLAGALTVWLWPGILNRMPAFVWPLTAYYLVQFLGPAMLAGSLAYSLHRRFLERRSESRTSPVTAGSRL